MNDRKQLIRSLETTIAELRKRRESPDTPPPERAELDAQIAELRAKLAELRAEELADAANDAALDAPEPQLSADMRELARRLDDAIAKNKQTAAIVNTIRTMIDVAVT